MKLYEICLYIGMIYTIIGLLSIKILDKLTKYNGDNITHLSDKHFNQFFYFNIFCLLYLNRIRTQRRIEYHERKLLLLTMKYNSIYDYNGGVDSDELREINEKILLMNRILKIEKIKNRK